MVNFTLIASSFIVPIIVSLIVCILVLGQVYVQQVQPLIDAAVENQAAVEKQLKISMTAMGSKSAEVRGDRALEKAVAGDLLEQFPEVEFILGLVSPSTAEMITENPEKALRLMERYKEFLPLLPGADNQANQTVYDL